MTEGRRVGGKKRRRDLRDEGGRVELQADTTSTDRIRNHNVLAFSV